jgi:hypothetical protein
MTAAEGELHENGLGCQAPTPSISLSKSVAYLSSRDGGTGRRSGLKKLRALQEPTGEVLFFLCFPAHTNEDGKVAYAFLWGSVRCCYGLTVTVWLQPDRLLSDKVDVAPGRCERQKAAVC